MQVLTPLFSIFILLAGGYVARRVGVLRARQSRALIDFSVIFALPCLIFERVYFLDFEAELFIFAGLGLASALLSALIALGLGWLCGLGRASLVSVFLLSCFGNTIFVGLPVITGILHGDPARLASEVIFYDALVTNLPMSLFGSFILSLGRPVAKIGLGRQIKNNLKKIISFPPFIALMLALAAQPLALPDFLFAPLRLFGGAAAPVALFAIGLGLSFGALKNAWKGTAIVLFAKLILPPFVFLGLAGLFALRLTQPGLVGIFECAMPTMSLAGALIMRAGLDSGLAASAVASTVAGAFLTLPALAWFLGV